MEEGIPRIKSKIRRKRNEVRKNQINQMEGIFMMKRAEIRIRGNVQMAGFRTFIKNVADSLNVTGFAENEGDGSVKVVCEGEEEGIKRLIDSVKEKSPSFVSIEGLDVAYEEYKGEFSGFERRGADVPGEEGAGAGGSEMVALMRSFDKKGEVMIGILNSTNETMGSMNETMGSMNETLKGVKGDTSHPASPASYPASPASYPASPASHPASPASHPASPASGLYPLSHSSAFHSLSP